MGRSAEPAAEGTGHGGSWQLGVSPGQVARVQEGPGGRTGVASCCRGPVPLLRHGLSEALDPAVASGWPPRSAAAGGWGPHCGGKAGWRHAGRVLRLAQLTA